MRTHRILSLAIAAVTAAGSAALAVAEDETQAQLRQVDVRRFVVAADGGAETGLFISRTATDGDEPVTRLQVLGSDAEAIDVSDLTLGETRSFDLGDGRWLDVTREEEELLLVLDDEEIRVPLNPENSLPFGNFPGAHREMNVVMVTGDDAVSAHGNHFVFVGEDGAVHEGTMDESFSWTDDGAFGLRGGAQVVIKHLGDGGSPHVLRVPAFPLAGLPIGDAELETLESLKGADPAVRAKVLEALREILSRHSAVTFDVDVDDDGTDAPRVRVRTRRGGDVQVQ